MIDFSKLNQTESLALLHARIATIEEFLSAMHEGFREDIVARLSSVVSSSSLPAASKQKIIDSAVEVQGKIRKPEKRGIR